LLRRRFDRRSAGQAPRRFQDSVHRFDEVGRAIRSATASSHKRLSLELGGKSPFIIFEDADLDSAVEGLVDGIWFNQGQVCCAGSRLLMQESIAEPLITKVRDRMSTLRAGRRSTSPSTSAPSWRECSWSGSSALWTRESPRRNLLAARNRIAIARTLLSADVAQQCASHVDRGPAGNLWSGVGDMTFRTPSEAVELANNTVYGLAACVWSESINVALHVASQLKAGVVWVNCTTCSTPLVDLVDTTRAATGEKAAGKACSSISSQTGSGMLRRCLPRKRPPIRNRLKIPIRQRRRLTGR